MLVNNRSYRTIWIDHDKGNLINIIDQRYLPHQFVIEKLATVHDVFTAIKDMHVRGAGLIGATAGYGMYLATLEMKRLGKNRTHLFESAEKIRKTRPTAVNLSWALDRQLNTLKAESSVDKMVELAKNEAQRIADEDAEFCKSIGKHGVEIIRELSRKKKRTINILTHCNAGWLAFVDFGSATAPIYQAFLEGLDIHVWVDETRPRNQGARLTAWELSQMGIPHSIVADNTGGHLMQHGMVDLVITGSDRTTYTGDVANKIGTYLKALAAHDNNIPFYVALPSSTFDWEIDDGLSQIPIEERSEDEVKYTQGLHEGTIKQVLLTPESSHAVNYGFDVTPSKYVTGIITERGVCEANRASILSLFPEKRSVVKHG